MINTNHKMNCKKKKTRFYEIYITKLLKQVSPENGITSNSKQQLNSILCSITRLISTRVNELTEIAKKKTMSEKEVINTLYILFPIELAKGMVAMCDQSVENYGSNHDYHDSKGITRQERAGIIFPPSVTEKYLRNFGYCKTMVSNSAPIALAAAIEYLAGEILENASIFAKQKKRVRLTIRDIEMGVRTDGEINSFFNKNNVSFLGGGVVPYIHPSLLVKRTRRRKSKKSEGKRSHRYRPGTVSIREIRRFQKTSNCLTLARSPFERYTRSILQKILRSDNNIKVSKSVFLNLQYFVEQQVVSMLQNAYMAAIHAGRVKLKVCDIEFISSIQGNKVIEDPVKTLEVDGNSSPRGKGEDPGVIVDTEQDIIAFEDLKDKQVES